MPEDFLLNYKDDILMEEDERLAEDFLHLQQRLQLLENGTNDRQHGEEQKKLIKKIFTFSGFNKLYLFEHIMRFLRLYSPNF